MSMIMDVVVPEGIGVGGVVQFEDEHGNMLEAVVPEGVGEGDCFQVEVDDQGKVHPHVRLVLSMEERAAERGGIMDLFVAWFERESVGDQVDSFMVTNAPQMRSAGKIDANEEQNLEWYQLYQDYQAQVWAIVSVAATQCHSDTHGCSHPPTGRRVLLHAFRFAQFEQLLNNFVAEAGCTVDDFHDAARDAEGMNEIYLQCARPALP